MIAVLFLWLLNFVISCINAMGCGVTWNETKYVGGTAHFMNWMGAIMSASGFTWCYTILLAFAGTQINIEAADHTMQPLLTDQWVQGLLEIGYLVVIFPIIGSGIAITINSWAAFWRRRTFGNGAVAGWNTFADVYNITHAVSEVPSAFSHLGSLFEGKGDKRGVLVIVLAAVALFGGILTTYTIVTLTADGVRKNRSLEYAMNNADAPRRARRV